MYSIFSEKYQSTIGVKIDRKSVQVDGKAVNLLLWDLHGDDEFQRVRATYLRGMAGYFLVVDGTRTESLKIALDLHQLAVDTVGDIPFIMLLNKCDLTEDWQIEADALAELRAKGWTIFQTSAKSGEAVDESFELLAKRVIGASP